MKWFMTISMLLLFLLFCTRWGKRQVPRALISLFFLYIVHSLLALHELAVTINAFSIVTVAVLGLPGVLMIIVLTFLK